MGIGHRWRLIILGFIGWTLFGVFFTLQNYASGIYFNQPLSFWATLWVWLICGYAWMGLTPLVIYLSQRFFIGRGEIARHLLVHFLAGSVLSLLQLSVFIFVRQMLLGNPGRPFSFSTDFQRLFVSEFHVNLLIYWIVVGVAHLRLINRRYLERERQMARIALETSQLETKLAQAQLDALKMQIHPHFLFNALNSISVLIRDDAKAANQMLVRLSDLLRATLKSGDAAEVSLKDELDFLRGYLEIEQTRFQDRLQVRFDVEEQTLEARVPNLILQPLVENAIKHGIAPRATAGKITITTRLQNGFVQLTVSDNGAGFGVSAKESNGIGLKNIQERLEKLYGEDQQCEINSKTGGGFEVKLKLPFINGRNGK